jgi:hypothetical protein
VILVLQGDGSVVLEQPTDFRRFHVEIAPCYAGVEQARAGFAAAGEIESAETAWVEEDALFALGEAAQGPGWREQAQAMVATAARYGWVRERAPRIKSHIVWRQG